MSRFCEPSFAIHLNPYTVKRGDVLVAPIEIQEKQRNAYDQARKTGALTFCSSDWHTFVKSWAPARARRLALERILVIGSLGKSYVTSRLNAVLGRNHDVRCNRNNQNNFIGVALAIARLQSGELLLIEAGAKYPGEIATLTSLVDPTTLVLTELAPVHVATFGGSLTKVVQAKLEALSFSPSLRRLITLAKNLEVTGPLGLPMGCSLTVCSARVEPGSAPVRFVRRKMNSSGVTVSNNRAFSFEIVLNEQTFGDLSSSELQNIALVLGAALNTDDPDGTIDPSWLTEVAISSLVKFRWKDHEVFIDRSCTSVPGLRDFLIKTRYNPEARAAWFLTGLPQSEREGFSFNDFDFDCSSPNVFWLKGSESLAGNHQEQIPKTQIINDTSTLRTLLDRISARTFYFQESRSSWAFELAQIFKDQFKANFSHDPFLFELMNPDGG